MSTPSHAHKIVLLTTGFHLPDRRLLFPRARLYMDRIELRAWGLSASMPRTVSFDHLRDVSWPETDDTSGAVVFHLDDEPPLTLVLDDVDRWKRMLDERVRWGAPGQFRVGAGSRALDLPLKELAVYASSLS